MGRPVGRPKTVQAPYKRQYKEDAFLRITFCSGNAGMAFPLLSSLRLEEHLLCLRVGDAR